MAATKFYSKLIFLAKVDDTGNFLKYFTVWMGFLNVLNVYSLCTILGTAAFMFVDIQYRAVYTSYCANHRAWTFLNRNRGKVVGLKITIDAPTVLTLALASPLSSRRYFSAPLRTVLPCSNTNQAVQGLFLPLKAVKWKHPCCSSRSTLYSNCKSNEMKKNVLLWNESYLTSLVITSGTSQKGNYLPMSTIWSTSFSASIPLSMTDSPFSTNSFLSSNVFKKRDFKRVLLSPRNGSDIMSPRYPHAILRHSKYCPCHKNCGQENKNKVSLYLSWNIGKKVKAHFVQTFLHLITGCSRGKSGKTWVSERERKGQIFSLKNTIAETIVEHFRKNSQGLITRIGTYLELSTSNAVDKLS